MYIKIYLLWMIRMNHRIIAVGRVVGRLCCRGILLAMRDSNVPSATTSLYMFKD